MARRGQGDTELRRSQTTIRYAIDALTEEEVRQLGIVNLHALLYPHMLIEDVSLWVMPPSLRRNDGARVILEPPNNDAEDLVVRALEREHYGRDPYGAVYEFFHRCAATMVASARAPYEIVYSYPPDSDKAVGFELFSISPATLLVEDGQLVQYVPQRYVATGKYPPRIRLDLDRLVIFEPPGMYREALAGAVPSLVAIQQSRGMDLALESFQVGREELPYDFQAHKHAEHAAVAEATKDIGWDARSLFREETLEYYQLYRQLMFMRFAIGLRECILETLNKALDAASQVVTPLGQLRLEGLPTSTNVEDALKHLEAGDRPFKDILAPFLSR